MNEERIKELFANEDFVKDLFESKSYEEAQKKLADNGIEVSVDELKKTLELVQKKQNGELSDEDLENVAGGSMFFFGLGVAAIVTTIGTFVGYNESRKRGC